jgi:phosphotransferase system  glucose/maltose/N-acetylglucosamine-specific IIC component
MELLHSIFGHVCGQVNVWSVGGQALPFCQRCTGLYVGGAWALLAWLLARPNPTARVLWVHGGFLLLMIPFGYHWLAQGPVLRTLTGYIFAFGLVYFLALNPWKRIFPLTQPNSCDRENSSYWGAFLAGIPILLAMLQFGGPFMALVLGGIGAAGLAIYLLLAGATVMSLLWRRRSHRAAHA